MVLRIPNVAVQRIINDVPNESELSTSTSTSTSALSSSLPNLTSDEKKIQANAARERALEKINRQAINFGKNFNLELSSSKKFSVNTEEIAKLLIKNKHLINSSEKAKQFIDALPNSPKLREERIELYDKLDEASHEGKISIECLRNFASVLIPVPKTLGIFDPTTPMEIPEENRIADMQRLRMQLRRPN